MSQNNKQLKENLETALIDYLTNYDFNNVNIQKFRDNLSKSKIEVLTNIIAYTFMNDLEEDKSGNLYIDLFKAAKQIMETPSDNV